MAKITQFLVLRRVSAGADAFGLVAGSAAWWVVQGALKALVWSKAADFVAPIVLATAAQLIAYETALQKGKDVDQLRLFGKVGDG